MNICMFWPFWSHHKYRRRSERFTLCKMLMKRGHHVYAITSRGPGMPKVTDVDGLLVFHVNSFVHPTIGYPILNLAELMSTIKRVVKRYKIEIFHFWNVEFPTTWPALFFRSMPRLLTIEGIPGINWFYGRRLVDVAGLLYSLSIGKLILNSFSDIVVFGRPIARYLTRLGIPEERIHIIPYDINVDEFLALDDQEDMRSKLGLKEDQVIILFVGRLVPVKGVELLLRVAEEVLTTYPGVRFLIVGDGPLRGLVADVCKKNPGVIYLGYRENIPSIMRISDILVLPSVSEGLPFVILEAGHMGLAVVATDVGAVPDLIINGKTGLLVNRGSFKQLVKALSLLIEDEALRKRLGMNLKKHIETYCRWDKVVDEYEKLYERILENRENRIFKRE